MRLEERLALSTSIFLEASLIFQTPLRMLIIRADPNVEYYTQSI
jgi:hypothetical protein